VLVASVLHLDRFKAEPVTGLWFACFTVGLGAFAAVLLDRLDARRLARLYGLAVGAALLLEGGLLLVLDRLPLALPFAAGDARHNLLHAAWGVVLLALLARPGPPRRAVAVVLGFGLFYSALAIAGVLVDRPLGLLVGPGENVFHFTVGALALFVGGLGAHQLTRGYPRRGSPSSSSASSAARVSSAAPSAGGADSAAPR
jgi:hypothetical protein